MTKGLRQLYRQRLELTKQLADLNRLIQETEKSDVWTASKRVHHRTDGCGQSKENRKYTSDWSLVDCIVCHKRRKLPRPERSKFPIVGEDWKRTVGA